MDESEYERKRRENMRQNAAALAALGLDDESTRLQERKRPRADYTHEQARGGHTWELPLDSAFKDTRWAEEIDNQGLYRVKFDVEAKNKIALREKES